MAIGKLSGQKKKQRKPRNYAANDATLINVRALNKKVADLNSAVNGCAKVVGDLMLESTFLRNRVAALEAKVFHRARLG